MQSVREQMDRDEAAVWTYLVERAIEDTMINRGIDCIEAVFRDSVAGHKSLPIEDDHDRFAYAVWDAVERYLDGSPQAWEGVKE